MTFALEQPDDQRLIAHLREGKETAEIVGWQPSQAAASLRAALDGAQTDGYGECFWLEPTGHFWWMLKREAERLEVVVLWSRSSAVGWQHIFRATDGFRYIHDLIVRALTDDVESPDR